MQHPLKHFIHLLFPHQCLACHQPLIDNEKLLCTHCLGRLPNIEHTQIMANLVQERLWGSVPIEKAIALFSFRKQGPIQTLLYNLKYQNHSNALHQLGKYSGQRWQTIMPNIKIDGIVPVPIHQKRLQQRRYNQSHLLAQGIAQVLHIHCHKWLRRIVHNTSQTKKKRQERFNNVTGAFTTAKNHKIKGKHLLLVDDLLTTGATLRECTHTLLTAGAQKISILVLAIAT